MIRSSAYETTACSGYIIDHIRDAVHEMIIQGLVQPFKKDTNDHDVYVVQGGSIVDEKVATFFHPIVIEKDHKKIIAVDTRLSGKWNSLQAEFDIRDKNIYFSTVLRGILNEIWVNSSPEYLKNVSLLPLDLYAGWLGEVIAKRVGLDTKDQANVTILAGIFYLNLFYQDKDTFNQNEKTWMVGILSRVTNLPQTLIFDAVEQYSVLQTLEDFCAACVSLTQSVRLQNFNVALLIQIIGGYWYGSNARETIAVALEHPPTWQTLIYQAITDRGMRNSGLTKILDRNKYKKQWTTYDHALLNLVNIQG